MFTLLAAANGGVLDSEEGDDEFVLVHFDLLARFNFRSPQHAFVPTWRRASPGAWLASTTRSSRTKTKPSTWRSQALGSPLAAASTTSWRRR
jgi:hypothetical protein